MFLILPTSKNRLNDQPFIDMQHYINHSSKWTYKSKKVSLYIFALEEYIFTRHKNSSQLQMFGYAIVQFTQQKNDTKT